MSKVNLSNVSTLLERVRTEIAKVIEGQNDVVEHLLTALIAGGHVLVEGVPGVAKTLLARCLAKAVQLDFSRIQFTPDLMPTDVTGVNVFQPQSGRFKFQAGPVFSDIVLADEINRAPGRTQASLLEAMQEYQVTVDDQTRSLSDHFMVIATQNPLEYEGTYPLPEAQTDRFIMKVIMGYPEEEAEKAMITRMHTASMSNPDAAIKKVMTVKQLTTLKKAVDDIEVDAVIIDYVTRLVRFTRSFNHLSVGASPRSAVMLVRAVKALALIQRQGYVTPDHVQYLAAPVLRHRIKLSPEAQIEGITTDESIKSLLTQVEVPRFKLK